jgi:hypothetical protein
LPSAIFGSIIIDGFCQRVRKNSQRQIYGTAQQNSFFVLLFVFLFNQEKEEKMSEDFFMDLSIIYSAVTSVICLGLILYIFLIREDKNFWEHNSRDWQKSYHQTNLEYIVLHHKYTKLVLKLQNLTLEFTRNENQNNR